MISGDDGATARRITERLSDATLREATGKGWEEWLAGLDAWGATTRGHTEIARHLREDQGVTDWHAQSIALGYAQERGLGPVEQPRAKR